MSSIATHFADLAKTLSNSDMELGIHDDKLVTIVPADESVLVCQFPSGNIVSLTEEGIQSAKKALSDVTADLLCGAWEGGSNYWYHLLKIDEKYITNRVLDYHKIADDVDLSIKVNDYIEGGFLGTLSQESIKNAWLKYVITYEDHFIDAVKGDWDGDTADVFFQLAVMGEIVFG